MGVLNSYNPSCEVHFTAPNLKKKWAGTMVRLETPVGGCYEFYILTIFGRMGSQIAAKPRFSV